MLFPKVRKAKRKGFNYQWHSTKTGFRYGTNSFRRWICFPFSQVAWKQKEGYSSRIERERKCFK
jgi:hypothetical protein